MANRSSDFPAWVNTVLSLIPTDKLAQNFLISFGDQWSLVNVFINLVIIAAFSGVFIALAVLRINKSMER